jgi:putative ABC transport system permease protein
VTRVVLRPSTLAYFYRRRLRAHRTQELLAGVGIAIAVALVFAASVTQGSIVSSTRQTLRAVVGPATLQLRARGPVGFSEAMLAQVEAIPGVKQAAPLLERSVRVIGPRGASASVYVAGTDVSLSVLDGLGRTLPTTALSHNQIALSAASARAIGISDRLGATPISVTLLIGGVRHSLEVSAVLGSEAVGVLSRAHVGVMALASMQTLLGEAGNVSRILVKSAPGRQSAVQRGLNRLAGQRLIVSSPEQDISLLEQALRPSGQASELFAVIGALLGFLFAFNAILMTVPERRRAIADLRLSGTRRGAIVQLASFQALSLGLLASGVGLAAGYALSRWVFHQSTAYLAEAFTLAGGTVVQARSVLVAVLGGVLVTCLASALPLVDLWGSQPRDAVYMQAGVPGNTLAPRTRTRLLTLALALLTLATVLYAEAPSSALLASVALALATVLAVPGAFAAVFAAARALSARAPRLSTLALALRGLRGTTLRSLALAATGAVALFGSVALGGARGNLLSGIHRFAHSYAADAPIWVSEPGDNQATGQLDAGTLERIARLPTVASVQKFQGAFLIVGSRRVWVIARPPDGAQSVLASQTVGGPSAAEVADARLARGGWIAVSEQIAAEHHTTVGGDLTLPTPAGPIAYRVAALTSNLAWSPGVIFMADSDFTRAWGTSAPSALAVHNTPGSDVEAVKSQIAHTLGPHSGLEVATAATRQASIDALTGEGLSQLGVVSTLLLIAAIMALAAALASSIHQRRGAMAELRLTGAPSSRLRRILLVEAALMLGAGCITGALAGIYGQLVIDAYLRHVTGFPVVGVSASFRPLEILALVLGVVLVAVAVPGWLASQVSPALALADE